MPDSLLKAPVALKEEDDLRKSQIHPENEVILLRGQAEYLEAEIQILKQLIKKGV